MKWLLENYKKQISQDYTLNKAWTGKYSWLMYLIIWNDGVYFCILYCVFRELTITHLYFPWANEV